MISTRLAAVGLAATLVAVLPLPAQAFSAKTYVASTGSSDSNACTFSLPCATIAHALSQTDDGGEISCLDSGDFTQAVNITKPVTIDCTGTSAVAGPFTVNVSGGTVFIKNLFMFANGQAAITLKQASELVVDHVHVTQDPNAILVQTTTASVLTVSNCIFRLNNTAVALKPGAGGSLTASFDHVTIEYNLGGGLKVDGTGGGPVTVVVTDSFITFNTSNGVNAVSGPSGNVAVNLVRDVIASNGLAGVQSNQNSGGTATVTVNATSVLNNATALEGVGSAKLLTFGDNRIVGVIGTGFTGTIPQQ